MIFNLCTIYIEKDNKKLGLYILNRIAPSPQVDIKFQSKQENPVNSNDFINRAFLTNGELTH